MQKMREELNANPVGANCIRPRFEGMTRNKGITLIALIITIIVMLILVGVTINVALNGGLFEKGEKAVFQTGASTVKEQLELAKALKVMNAEGKPVEDYSEITVGKLEGLDQETISKYASILVVNKNGDICYNPAEVNVEEKVWLEELGIKPNESKPVEPEDPYTNLYNVAYEKSSFELAVYKNRMYTIKTRHAWRSNLYR